MSELLDEIDAIEISTEPHAGSLFNYFPTKAMDLAVAQAKREVAALEAKKRFELAVVVEKMAHEHAERWVIAHRGVSPAIFYDENGVHLEPWMAYLDVCIAPIIAPAAETAINQQPVVSTLRGRPVTELQSTLL